MLAGCGRNPLSGDDLETVFTEDFESGSYEFTPIRRGREANPGVVHATNTAKSGEYMLRTGRLSSFSGTLSIPNRTVAEFSFLFHHLQRRVEVDTGRE